MQMFHSSSLLSALGAMCALGFAVAPLSASNDELVVVDEGELNAYWRGDHRDANIFQLSGEGPATYGCIAVPFVIEPNGSVGPGLRPLLLRTSPGAPVASELYEFAVGAMPRFQPTWDKRPSLGIYSSRSIVFMDTSTADRLGTERGRQLRDALTRACRIEGLASWLGQHDDQTVERTLPSDPAQWLDHGAR